MTHTDMTHLDALEPTLSAALDEIANKIKGAQNLDELIAGLRAFETACKNNASAEEECEALDQENEMRVRVDMTGLPTFGGEAPADTSGVWSWSASRLLVGACISEMQIVARR